MKVWYIFLFIQSSLDPMFCSCGFSHNFYVHFYVQIRKPPLVLLAGDIFWLPFKCLRCNFIFYLRKNRGQTKNAQNFLPLPHLRKCVETLKKIPLNGPRGWITPWLAAFSGTLRLYRGIRWNLGNNHMLQDEKESQTSAGDYRYIIHVMWMKYNDSIPSEMCYSDWLLLHTWKQSKTA